MTIAHYRVGDVFERMAEIPDGSVDLIVTSPPFLALRSYLPADHPDKHLEIGSEATPAAFLSTLLALTREFRRVLAPHGSICVELGDTYSGAGGYGSPDSPNPAYGAARFDERWTGRSAKRFKRKDDGWPLAKSLTGIPTLYAWSLAYGRNLLTEPFSAAELLHWIDGLRARGFTAEQALAMAGGWVAEHGIPYRFPPWRIRNVIVWGRPNPPVGALGDKFRPATSYITVACPGPKRWFDLDAVRTEHIGGPHAVGSAMVNGQPRGTTGGQSNPAGAPPLDWHADDHPEDGDWLWKLPTHPYPGSHYACVDDQTEALTPHGWRRHDQLRDGDLIATWTADTETWRFEPATFHRYPYDGDLVAIEKRVTSQRLTPNHRVVYATRKDPTWRIRRADTLTGACRIPVASPMESGGVGPGEKAAAIAGWFCTEGSIVHGWPRIYQSVTANPDKVDAIRSLLDGLGATYAEHAQRRSVHGSPYTMATFTVKGALAEWLRQFHKHIPLSAVFGWSDVDARALFDAMVDGDGHRRPDGRMSFIQKAKPVAEAFQLLALRLGYRTTLSQRADGQWLVYVSHRRTVDLRRGNGGNAPPTELERYVGTVWCPSVSTGMWLARRNGQPFITGNTYPTALPARLIQAMCPRRVCTTCGKASERIVERRRPNVADDRQRVKFANGERPAVGRMDRAPEIGWEIDRTTLGWTDCGHDTWRNGLVLDPFGGSGTTGVAASGLGRDSVLIDLDERNVDLARDRIGMFLSVDEATA